MLNVSNVDGTAPAVFASGAILLQDDLDTSGGLSYGPPTVDNVNDVGNEANVHCAIDASETLTCTEVNGPVTLGAGDGSFNVTVPVTGNRRARHSR